LLFRYNGQAAMPAGQYHESPTEMYLNNLTAAQNAYNMQAAAAAAAAQGNANTNGAYATAATSAANQQGNTAF
jgi:hypothetical protein